MIKFITPVSMQVTKEQYEKDLRDKLLKMGYKENGYEYRYTQPYLLCGWYTCNNEMGFNQDHGSIAYKIPTYNPELFLALAGMREDKEIKVGDWVIPRYYTDLLDRVGPIGILQEDDEPGRGPYRYNVKSKDGSYWYTHVRHANKEEIINHFTKQEWQEPKHILGDKIFMEKPEPIFRKGDTVWHWKHGKGEIKEIEHGKNIYVLFDKCEFGSAWIIVSDIELSFTPYNLKDGGFSQERPKPEIKTGMFVKSECETVLIVSDVGGKQFSGTVIKSRYSPSTVGLYSTTWSKIDFKPIENPLK